MGMVIIIFSNVEHFLPLRLQFSQLINVLCRFIFHKFTISLP
ncbi:tonB-dependent receptor yncD [Escherichia coli]|nr:tonB-dependent receptor yncD [Escherichia coli]EFO0096212.1 tonB-dependent receptor yncD [Escherichia coli]EFO3528965.1 tonB-dependent receptor yncD [Escherichia coli]EFO3570415.1 tonB-dependent receptor yncD [Escherichia coli]EGO9438299.1 tonB-dependent receptor yncD [Escherichia coli]